MRIVADADRQLEQLRVRDQRLTNDVDVRDRLAVAAHAENGMTVSSFLRDQPGVTDVRWPGFAGMACFRHPEAVRIVAATKLFALAESLGGVESLIEVPQAMTHQSVEGSSAAVPSDLVRVSCGIEAAADLVEDLRQAIASVTPAGVGS